MANVFDFLKPKASLSRNGFDLSQRHLFTLKAGQRVPVLALDCLPNDYHEIDLVSLVRTLPLQTDAYVGLKVHYEFGYVPYWQLWHEWNDFILQTRERFSVTESMNLPTQCPSVSIVEFLMVLRIEMLSNQEGDMFNFDRWHNAIRLLDMLGYGDYSWFYDYNHARPGDDKEPEIRAELVARYGDKRFNVFRVAAYNKFCQDYGRSVQYEPLEPSYFNWDDYDNLSEQGRAEKFLNQVCRLYYALWKKDMFTGVMSSPQFGAVSSVDLGTFNIIASKYRESGTVNVAVAGGNQTNKGKLYNSADNQTNFDFTSTASIDVYQLRKAEMFQKWKEDKLRAGNKLKDQAAAMWGSPFKYSLDNYSQYIKEIVADVSIDEVINQSAQGQVALGEIAGKGIGTGNGKLTFTCDDFGVLLCVAYVAPSTDYDSVGLDKNNTLVEPFDFATPHFENLGFESVHAYQLNFKPNLNPDFSFSPGIRNFDSVLGYAPRYLNYKTAFNKVHGEFSHSARWNSDGQLVQPSLSSWTATRMDMESTVVDYVSVRFLHVDPHVLDSIFLVNADATQDTDQFLFNVNFIINSVRSLSVLGLPRW